MNTNNDFTDEAGLLPELLQGGLPGRGELYRNYRFSFGEA